MTSLDDVLEQINLCDTDVQYCKPCTEKNLSHIQHVREHVQVARNLLSVLKILYYRTAQVVEELTGV